MDRTTKGQRDLADQIERDRAEPVKDRRHIKGSIALANQSEAIDRAAKTFMGFPILTRGQREHEAALAMVASTGAVLGDDHPLSVSPLDEVSDGPFGTLDDEEAGVFEQVPDPPVKDEVEDCSTCDGMAYCQECDGGGECPMCDGFGEEDGIECMDCGSGGSCPSCDGTGDCDDCDGLGTVPKGGK